MHGLDGDLQKDGGFNKRTFERQMCVLRGQIFNLREALRSRKTPEQLFHVRGNTVAHLECKTLVE
jgi:hypothetical protein